MAATTVSLYARLSVDHRAIPPGDLPGVIQKCLTTDGLVCERIVINGIGRKKLNVNVKFVSDVLGRCFTVGEAANILGISRGYIYGLIPDPKRLLKGRGNNAASVL